MAGTGLARSRRIVKPGADAQAKQEHLLGEAQVCSESLRSSYRASSTWLTVPSAWEHAAYSTHAEGQHRPEQVLFFEQRIGHLLNDEIYCCKDKRCIQRATRQ